MTENKKHSVSITVLVLSIVSALGIGWMAGAVSFALYSQYRMALLLPPQGTVITDSQSDGPYGVKRERIVRREILYHKPGGDRIWRDRFEVLATGTGRITGRVYNDDRPMAGVKLALLFAKGKRSQIVETDATGAYEIPLQPGSFYFNGFLFFNREKELAGRLLVNRLMKYEGLPFFNADGQYGKTVDEFEALRRQYGSEEAARLMAAKVLDDSRQKFQFEVTDPAFTFPDLHFRKLIAIVGPKGTLNAALDDIKFIWGPHPRAASYRLAVSEIIKQGTTTRYNPIASVKGIKEPFITYSDLVEETLAQKSENCIDDDPVIIKGRLYGFRIMAYDMDDRILTASSEHSTEMPTFSVK